METSTKVNGKMIKQTVLVNTYTMTEPSMKANGWTTSNMAMVLRRGQMRPGMRVHTSQELSMVTVHFIGTMEPAMSVNSRIMTSVDKVSILGATIAATMENGRRTRCMELVFSIGTMVAYTKVSLPTIAKRAAACLSGPTVASIKDNGETENRMVLGTLHAKLAPDRRENGEMERYSTGSTKMENGYQLSFQEKI